MYRITYRDPDTGQVETLTAKSIGDSAMGFGFVRVAEFVFDNMSTVINPQVERLSSALEDVRARHLNIHLILGIDELKESDDLKDGLSPDRLRVVVPFSPDGDQQ